MLDESTLVEAVCNFIPAKWQNDMAKMAFDPTDHSLEEFQTFLERIEMIEATEGLSLTKKRKSDDSDDKKTSKNYKSKSNWKKSKNESSSDSPCQLCTIFSGNSNSHKTSECNKKKRLGSMLKDDASGKKSHFKNNTWKRSEELNLHVKKQVNKLLKKSGITVEDDVSRDSE
jgi:hypothetical protein